MKRFILPTVTAAAIVAIYAACSDNSSVAPRGVSAPHRPSLAKTVPFNDEGQCLAQDWADAGKNPALDSGHCTANDVSIAGVDIKSFFDAQGEHIYTGQEIHCKEGDPIILKLNAHLEQTDQAERDNIGIWIATDGGDARNGQCNHYNLVAPDFGTTVEGVSNKDGDECGDLFGHTVTGDVSLGTVTYTCATAGSTTTTLHIGSCLSWQQNDGFECPSGGVESPHNFRVGTLPGTSSKCNCSGFDLPIIVDRVAHLEVVKACVPTSDGGKFNLSINGTVEKTDATCTSPDNTTGSKEVSAGTNQSPGATVTFGEANGTGTDLGSYTSTRVCVDRAAPNTVRLASGAGTGGSFTIQPNQDIICTITNTRLASVTIKKVTDPAETDAATATSFAFSQNFDATGNFNLIHNGTKTFSNVTPGAAKTVVETDPTPGYDLTSIVCTGAATYTGTVATRTLSVTPAAGEVITCTFTNRKRGTVTIKKVTDPAESGAGATSFSFSQDFDATGNFSLIHNGTKTFSGIVPGAAKTVVESDPTPGYDLTSIVCTGAATYTGTVATRTLSVTPAAGETITCTFTNTKRGSITIVKDDQNPEKDATDFAFTTTGAGLSGFSLDDDDDPTLSNTKPFSNLVPGGSRVITEGANSNWDLTAINCTGSGYVTDVPNRKVTITLANGGNVTCTFVNQRKARLTITKVVTGGGSQTFEFSRTGISNFTLGNGGSVSSGFLIAPGTYTVCELNLAVAWAATATLDGNPLVGATFFNPDVGQDLGTRCASIVLAYGDDRTLVVTNNPPPTPGGNARTIGYWKNWSSCAQSNGKQYDKAKARGDWSKTLDGNLPQQIGDLFLAGAPSVGAASPDCAKAVSILDKTDIVTGKKMASDAAYGLAAQLLAAKLSIQAGADATVCHITNLIADAQNFLANTINFTGTGSYLSGKAGQQALIDQANFYAGLLDKYNNNNCVDYTGFP